MKRVILACVLGAAALGSVVAARADTSALCSALQRVVSDAGADRQAIVAAEPGLSAKALSDAERLASELRTVKNDASAQAALYCP